MLVNAVFVKTNQKLFVQTFSFFLQLSTASTIKTFHRGNLFNGAKKASAFDQFVRFFQTPEIVDVNQTKLRR